MFSHLYSVIIYDPLYNGLIYLMDVFPWMDAGIAIIVFTVIVRLVLFPLSRQSIKTQIMMRELQPEIAAIQKKYANKQEQTVKTMELYRERKVHPFAGTLLLIVQLPILIAIYSIFARSGLPQVNAAILYPFVHVPAVNIYFLGFLNIASSSVVMAFIAAVTQYLQLRFSLASQAPASGGNDVAASMSRNMRYFMPAMIFILALRFPVAISLYWAVGNLFMLGQELFVRFHHEKGKEKAVALK